MTEALKQRILLELRAFWAAHPKYRDIVNNIQGKYSFKERVQYGIVLKASSANQVQLSADNFLGTVESYVHLAKVENYPGLSVEWVRENAVAVQQNGGLFPTLPGVYYITLTEVNEFYVYPMINVNDEVPTKLTDDTYQLEHSYVDGSLRLFQMPGSFQLQEGINYTENASTGEIVLMHPLDRGQHLSADYRYEEARTGPWSIKENFSNNGALPGVVLAFGRRCEKGDRFAVIVGQRRDTVALEYGGRWEINLDFDVIASDPFAQQEIADNTVMFLWAIARPRLSTEGIEISNVTMGGESEEVKYENSDEYYYNASFSLTVNTDWAVHVPLTATLRRVTPQTQVQVDATAALTDDELREVPYNDVQDIDVYESLGLQEFSDPFFSGKTITFEKIR